MNLVRFIVINVQTKIGILPDDPLWNGLKDIVQNKEDV